MTNLKWKARARELRADIREMDKPDERFYVLTHGEADELIEAAITEAAAEQQELDAQLCDIAAAGHDEAFAAADRDPALTETQREAIKDRIAARSRTASGLATAIRARQSREQKP